MNNKFAKFNIILVSAFIYTLCVYLTLQQGEESRLYIYRILTGFFIILLFVFNSNNIYFYSKSLLIEFLNRCKQYFGYKDEIKKEDKVRTFIE